MKKEKLSHSHVEDMLSSAALRQSLMVNAVLKALLGAPPKDKRLAAISVYRPVFLSITSKRITFNVYKGHEKLGRFYYSYDPDSTEVTAVRELFKGRYAPSERCETFRKAIDTELARLEGVLWSQVDYSIVPSVNCNSKA